MTLVQKVCVLAPLLPPVTTFAKRSNTMLSLQLTYTEALARL